MEEDIKILEKFIECDNMFMTIDMLKNEDTIKAIENLIARNKELEEDNYDLNELKKQAIEIVLKELENQDTEINKLNNVIDRMAEVIEECRQNDCIETTEDLDMSEIAGVEKIKEYFMKEDK